MKLRLRSAIALVGLASDFANQRSRKTGGLCQRRHHSLSGEISALSTRRTDARKRSPLYERPSNRTRGGR